MNGVRFAIVGILGSAIIGGALMYYQLVYAGYAELDAAQVGEIQVINTATEQSEPLLLENVKGIDTVVDGVRLSGAISFRACFDVVQSQAMLTETYVVFDDAVPLTAPSWFDCFDAKDIGARLESGEAIAFMSLENITYGVDRIVAVLPDGRGYAWHQLNACGEAVFAGDNTPDGCPELPEDS